MVKDDLAAWLADVRRQQKPTTHRFYAGRSKWIRAALGDAEWSALKGPQILRALDAANRWPDGNPKAPDTIRGNMVAWEQFQKWAIATGRCELQVLTAPLDKPSGQRRERMPSPEEVQRIVAGASPEFVRIYQALLLTGSRPGELCGAMIANWDREKNVVALADHKTVKKTRRPRLIPVASACQTIFLQAIGERVEGPIFLTPGRKAWTTSTLSQTFRRRRELLQLGDDLVLYSTRHKFATELCHSMGLEAAAAVLGHSNLQTTRRYVHHGTEQLLNYAGAVDTTALLGKPPEPPAG